MSKPFYITTAIHYVNDVPTSATSTRTSSADVIARYRRMHGDDVHFLTGTDEHGQKIERTRREAGHPPDRARRPRRRRAPRELDARLGISNDDFIRTTQPRHRDGVYEIIRRMRERNPDDIYHGEHSGWYCQSEETFVPESQVADGKCPERASRRDGRPSDNYFFRLSKYEKPLLDFYRGEPRLREAARRASTRSSRSSRQGLRDLSVSRTAIKWGIPFPGDQEHVIYVWLDALTNYISALGFGSDDHALREVLARRRAPDRQGHRPLPRRLLAGLPDVGGASAPEVDRRARLVAARQRRRSPSRSATSCGPTTSSSASAPTRSATTCCARWSSGRTRTTPTRRSSRATTPSSRTASATRSPARSR